MAGLGIEVEVLAILSWLLLLKGIHLAVWPSLKASLREFAYPAAMSASLLILTLLTWYCGLVHLPLPLALAPFGVLAAIGIRRGAYTLEAFSRVWKWEVLFLIAFLFMLEANLVDPTISYAEKFMDHAFIASIMRSPTVPPLDPWFAGGSLSIYYYMGYWLVGALGILTGNPSAVAFNLALPTLFALSAVNLWALGRLLLTRFTEAPLLVLFLPNPAFFYAIWTGTDKSSILWNSTRTLANTIHEYPLFSFLWGDVHSHVIALFNQIFLLFLLVYAVREWYNLKRAGKVVLVVLASLSLGSMPPFNTWDVFVYAPLVVMAGAVIWYYGHNHDNDPGVATGRSGLREWLMQRGDPTFLLAVPSLAVLIYLPFILQMERTGVKGMGWVISPSDPFQFLLVHGFFIALVLFALGKDIVRRPYLIAVAVPFALLGYTAAGIAAIPLTYILVRRDKGAAGMLTALGLIVIIVCEFLYMKDSMGTTFFRMNTVFKFYVTAWILLGIGSITLAAARIDALVGPHRIPKSITRAAALSVIIALLAAPFFLPSFMYHSPYTLDGSAYLAFERPGDYQAIQFLKGISGDLVLVEAEGGDYTYHSRISSFSGIPTVIGMPYHEFQWRGDEGGWLATRTRDVRIMYEDPVAVLPLMEQYNADLLYVGETERESYHVTINESALVPVYQAGDVTIYRPRDRPFPPGMVAGG